MMSSIMKISFILACLAVASGEEIRAIAVLNGAVVRGNVTFVQNTDGGPVSVTGEITGLQPGPHGFHVHEKGDLSGGCASSGGHFNPEMTNHGAPSSPDRHVGDLGNIEANKFGIAKLEIVDSVISLLPSSHHNIIGRAVVVHAGEDDYGFGGHSDSLTSGHAGARLACGVIGIQSPSTNLASQASLLALPNYYLGAILTMALEYFIHA